MTAAMTDLDTFRALLPLAEKYLQDHPGDFNAEMRRRVLDARAVGLRLMEA